MDQDSDDFGPMIGAENCVISSDNSANMSNINVDHILQQKRQSEEEFGRQRARFMELFHMKEEQLKSAQQELENSKKELSNVTAQVQQLSNSLDDARTALVIAELRKADELTEARKGFEEELNSLRLIVSAQADQDSVEEYRKSLAYFTRRNEKLEAELAELKGKLSENSEEGFLSTITKTIHKRVGSAPIVLTQEEENLEDSMKKAQQDTAMLRAVITPMEHEIEILKQHLRRYEQRYGPISLDVTDSVSTTLLGELGPSASDPSINSSFHTSAASSMPASPTCRKCLKLEVQLDTSREAEKRLQDQLITVQRLLEAERQSVAAQAAYTSELETSLQSATAEAEQQISALKTRSEEAERFMSSVRQRFIEAHNTFQRELATMTCSREEVQAELMRLQGENEILGGKHLKHSQQLQDERINLPNTIQEMQELLLKYQDELITTKVAHERCQETMGSDIEFLSLQLNEQRGAAESMSQRINELEEALATQNSINSERLERQRADVGASDVSNDVENQSTGGNTLKKQVLQLKADKILLEQTVQELNAQISSFRTDLSNSEAVQKDLISLSRSLQVQLEKIRAGENEVRWQHPDDVDQCDDCKVTFNQSTSSSAAGQKFKENCSHCGHVFCPKCLSKVIQSKSRKVPVCNMCYTLLDKDSAPYLGNEHATSVTENNVATS